LVVYLEDNTVSTLGEARRYRDHGGYRNWATQLRHLAGHLAGRTDLVTTNHLQSDLETVVEENALTSHRLSAHVSLSADLETNE
jgi:hypothetical protein